MKREKSEMKSKNVKGQEEGEIWWGLGREG